VREDDGARYGVRTPLVQAYERRERFGVAALGGDHERVLTLASRRLRRREHSSGVRSRVSERQGDRQSSR